MTEDYEIGLRIGALGPQDDVRAHSGRPGERGVVASRGHFPATLGSAVRQKARWLGGIALAGWDRLGWSGGIGERWMRLRDRRGPLAALLLLAAYGRPCCGRRSGLPKRLARRSGRGWIPALITLLTINGWLLAWRNPDARRASPPRPTGLAKVCCRFRGSSSAMSIAMLAAARAV